MFADGVIESSTTLGTVTYELGRCGRLRPAFPAGLRRRRRGRVLCHLARQDEVGVRDRHPHGRPALHPDACLDQEVEQCRGEDRLAGLRPVPRLFDRLRRRLAGLATGNLAETRPWWVRSGGRWWDLCRRPRRVVDRQAGDRRLRPTSRVGIYDVVKDAYFADGRRPWAAVGAANKVDRCGRHRRRLHTEQQRRRSHLHACRRMATPASVTASRSAASASPAGGQYGIVLTPGGERRHRRRRRWRRDADDPRRGPLRRRMGCARRHLARDLPQHRAVGVERPPPDRGRGPGQQRGPAVGPAVEPTARSRSPGRSARRRASLPPPRTAGTGRAGRAIASASRWGTCSGRPDGRAAPRRRRTFSTSRSAPPVS